MKKGPLERVSRLPPGICVPAGQSPAFRFGGVCGDPGRRRLQTKAYRLRVMVEGSWLGSWGFEFGGETRIS